MIWVFGWRRGVCMVRKWNWYLLTGYRASSRDFVLQIPSSGCLFGEELYAKV